MTKGEAGLCTKRGHYDEERVYDRSNNSTLAANLCIRQDDNERGACRSDAKKSLFVIGRHEIPSALNRILTISKTTELIERS